MRILILFFCLLLTGCSPTKPAPVIDGWDTSAGQNSQYIVRKGDSIYTIAWVFGLDYKAIAQKNNLRPPYNLPPGSTLTMPSSKAVVPSVATASTVKPKNNELASSETYSEPSTGAISWAWPVRGRVVARFGVGNPPNKGIDISAPYGSPVHAAANGVVVYSGDGLPGYGKLIIVKHVNNQMSAYAYNSKILVKFGSKVRQGQTISYVGRDQSGAPLLHFEVRYNGKPKNPLSLLR